ncbi:hypothetical protein PVAP13_6KG382606 [Panicum virgatum]|uniref:Uncharacterized protein n=1 Tax=Panicum virgatum TaxID=38727 RepID=A0A8T0RH16_PANVG|nr:hypothetical protein PVAP13_6KG382606 [Panicum virgatum]
MVCMHVPAGHTLSYNWCIWSTLSCRSRFFLLQFYMEVIYLFIQADATELTNVFFLFFVHLKHAKFECVKFMWFSPASEVERGIITTSVMWSVCRKIKSKTR